MLFVIDVLSRLFFSVAKFAVAIVVKTAIAHVLTVTTKVP